MKRIKNINYKKLKTYIFIYAHEVFCCKPLDAYILMLSEVNEMIGETSSNRRPRIMKYPS